MAAKLTFRYDQIGDILFIDKCPPYEAQGSRQLDDEIVVRSNPDTGDVETLEILFFSKRLLEKTLLELPIDADLRLGRLKA